MAEQYGIACADLTSAAWDKRSDRLCPFKGMGCTKKGGVCSITDGKTIAITCPNRFLEGNILFAEICHRAFGTSKNCLAIKEVPFLISKEGKTIGKIDNIIIHAINGKILDWCAVEIQSVYFSGEKLTPEIEYFEKHRTVPKAGRRRPDYRSSGPKRLLPQLETKIPTLRRWGKKMFVVVDHSFFQWMPTIQEESHLSNADICWVVFDLEKTKGHHNNLILSKVAMTTLEKSRAGLVGGESTSKPDFEESLTRCLINTKSVVWHSASSS
jgi:hypothetical protein